MAKPARRRRSAISAWQPASSGVSEGRAISSQARVSKSDMWFAPSARAKTQLVYLVGKANADHTIVGNQHRPLDQRRVLAQQQCPLRSRARRSEEHTSALQSLMRISYAVFCLKT